MSTSHIRDIQMLRRQALWFRQFARLGAPADRTELDSLAENIEHQAQQAWQELVAEKTRH